MLMWAEGLAYLSLYDEREACETMTADELRIQFQSSAGTAGCF